MKLSELKKDDKVLCINFSGYDVYKMGYVTLEFRKDDRKDWQGGQHFNAIGETGLGCSSWIRNEQLKKHCFLSDFGGYYYFFTLKPEQWKEDLKDELNSLIKRRKENFNKEMKKLSNKIDFLILANNNKSDLRKINCKIHNDKEATKVMRKIKINVLKNV